MTRAKRRAEDQRLGRSSPLLTVSMPAAELFGAWAVAAAAARAMGHTPRAVVAIGECDPAAAAIDTATSPRAQMRWRAVSVPREANGDADRLNHPHELPAVRREAEAAGLRARVAPIPDECWATLRASAQAAADEAAEEAGMTERG
eukprot:1869483-Pleurochrysis_carterae.AAC.1